MSNIGNKSKVGRLTLPNIKIYNKAVSIKVLWYQHKYNEKDHNRESKYRLTNV